MESERHALRQVHARERRGVDTLGVEHGKVRFDYRGRHRVLFENISPADVRWICQRLQSLTDAQWHDAFRAGGFPAPVAERFIRRMKQKIDEGLSLKDS